MKKGEETYNAHGTRIVCTVTREAYMEAREEDAPIHFVQPQAATGGEW